MRVNGAKCRGVTLVAAAATVVVVLATPLGAEGAARRARPPRAVDPLVTPVDPRDVTAMTAEVAIRRTRVGGDGAVREGASPAAVKYRIERTRTPGGWRSVLRRLPGQRPAVDTPAGRVTLDGAPAVIRLEDAGDGTPVRVFNARDVEVPLPSRARLRALAAGQAGALRSLGLPDKSGEASETSPVAAAQAEPLLGLVHPASARGARRLAIRQRLGEPVARVRGLDRHVTRDGAHEVETLVDPVTAVPLEVTVTRDGATVERVRHSYAGMAGGGLVRRGVRSERVLPGGGDRVIVDVEFSGLRVELGGAR